MNISNLSKVLVLLFGVTLVSCDFEFELPDSNSQVDTDLPEAVFTAQQDVADFATYLFINQSSESTDYIWDFGTGDSSNEESPIYRFEDGEGTYTVSLTAMDANGESSTITQTIEVIEPEIPPALIPTIFEHSFEDGQLDGGSGDGRDSWRNSDLGGVIQITSSPVFDGSQASKYPSAGDRIAYQELPVSANTDYEFEFVYTLKTDAVGSITFDVLAGGGYTDVTGATVLGTFTGDDQTDANVYTEGSVIFNTGANELISIYIHNEGAEARLDLIEISAIQ